MFLLRRKTCVKRKRVEVAISETFGHALGSIAASAIDNRRIFAMRRQCVLHLPGFRPFRRGCQEQIWAMEARCQPLGLGHAQSLQNIVLRA